MRASLPSLSAPDQPTALHRPSCRRFTHISPVNPALEQSFHAQTGREATGDALPMAHERHPPAQLSMLRHAVMHVQNCRTLACAAIRGWSCPGTETSLSVFPHAHAHTPLVVYHIRHRHAAHTITGRTDLRLSARGTGRGGRYAAKASLQWGITACAYMWPIPRVHPNGCSLVAVERSQNSSTYDCRVPICGQSCIRRVRPVESCEVGKALRAAGETENNSGGRCHWCTLTLS